jgi:ubiquinone/menaquinone biosynthesis C-methylase UbiE
MEKPDLQESINKAAQPKPVIAVILKLFFQLLYHQFAWAYDGVAWVVSLGAWQGWVRSVAASIDGPTVLEIGFGPGHLLTELARKGIVAIGLDESCQMIRLAKKRFIKKNLSGKLLRGEAQTLPLTNECIHQVVMTFPAEYILNPLTLAEVHRVLVNRGKAYILPFAWITSRSPIHRLAAWVNRITGEAPTWNERLLAPLENTGFEVNWEMKDFGSSKAVLIQLTKQQTK